MPRYAVGYMDFHDHDLRIEIVEAEDWHEALGKHSAIGVSDNDFPDKDLDAAKEAAFDADCMIDVVLIP